MNSADMRTLDQAADILCVARLNATAIADLPESLRPQSVEQSYLLQDCLNQKLTHAGLGPAVGYKIGCTTEVMQAYLNIPHPCVGSMFESTLKTGDGVFDIAHLCRPGVECEIAVQIEKDMSAGNDYTPEHCDHYVGTAMVSIELVDDRWTDYQQVTTPTLIADNFFAAGCVLGGAVNASGDLLRDAIGTMMINGQRIGSGRGADIYGHPFAALSWLANHQVSRGSPLRAGDYVSLGSVVQTQWLNAGDVVDIEFTDLGRCSLRFGR